MYLIPFVLFFFPTLSFLIGVLGIMAFRAVYVAPSLVFIVSLIAQFLYFNSTFFMWVCIYTLLAYLGGMVTKRLSEKVKSKMRVKKVMIILTSFVFTIGIIMVLTRPMNEALMETKVINHLEANGYKKNEVESIRSYHNSKLNTDRTKPTIVEVVFKDDLAHKYRYIGLRAEDKIIQMCEYEKRPNFFVSDFTEERPHMIKNCY